MDMQEALRILKKGVAEIIPEEELVKKLQKSKETGTPLRIKYGIDPTGHEVHIGHLVPIRKMREFQDLGHIGVIVIGDFTARIGDPTGRDTSRPPLTAEKIKQNASNYMQQLYTVLDESKTEVRWQSEWFEPLGLDDVLKLLGKYTLAQFMAHDTFRKRWEEGQALGMHEIMYPVLQAYDSIAIKADVELGATEQKFNILAGRDMQRWHNMPQQVAMLSPILMGTDGVNKMSKSLNNYIAVFDTPQDKYGKVMSIPDNLIINYFNYATCLHPDEIAKFEAELAQGTNPKIIKQRLAREIVAIYHGTDEATKADEEFNRVFAKKDVPDEMDEYAVSGKVWIVNILSDSKLCASNGEARRMLKQGAVSLDGERVTDPDLELAIKQPMVLKVGKRRFMRLIKG